MSYFDKLEEICEQTKTSKDWAIFKKGLEKTSFKSMKTRRTEAKIKAVKYMGNCCNLCGLEYHHSAMEFHHVRGIKSDLVSKLLLKDWKEIKEELRKCILVCSNCHAVEHWEKHHPGEGRYGPIKT